MKEGRSVVRLWRITTSVCTTRKRYGHKIVMGGRAKRDGFF